jgi:tetratricopeptide (TPR) repeat protein
MGDAYLRLRKYKEAIEVLEKVVSLTRPEDVIYEAIGHCYHKMGKIAQARFYYKKAVHLNPDDSKLYYKIATTYMLEKQWQPAIKQLENAMRMHRAITEYNLAMGECKLNLGQYKEAVHYFGVVVKHKPKNVSGWEALINCLLAAEYFDEALLQSKNALDATDYKPIFLFYQSAILFVIGKSKEGLILLEQAMAASPKLLKKFIDVRPSILQNAQVVDVIARFKRRRKI